MPTHVVKALALNLRSEPDPDGRNIIAVLPQGHPVTKLADAPRPSWFKVRTSLAGRDLEGFLNGDYLTAAGGAGFQTGSAHAGQLPRADLGRSTSAKRTSASNRAHAIGEPGRPDAPSTHGQGRAAGLLRVIDWLNVGRASNLRWKPGGGATYCNIYVYDVCCLAGPYLPRVWWTSSALVKLAAGQQVAVQYGQTVTELAANYIFEWLKEHGGSFGWRRLFDPDDLQTEVNGGRVGIICAQRTNMNSPGHIQIVAPEHGDNKAKRIGGRVTQPLQSNAGASNFTYGHLGSNWWQGASFRDFGFWTNGTA